MKISILISIFIGSLLYSCSHSENHSLKGKSSDPFITIDFDSVVAYDFAGNTHIPLIDSTGRITKTATKQVKLDSIKLNVFRNILMDTSVFGGSVVVDFYPHFGLAFYKNNRIVDHLEVSLMCNNIYASFKIPEQEKKKPDNFGLTEVGVQKIWQFCKDLNFTQYLDKSQWPK